MPNPSPGPIQSSFITRSFWSANSPRHMSAITITTVETGRRMLKSERIMA